MPLNTRSLGGAPDLTPTPTPGTCTCAMKHRSTHRDRLASFFLIPPPHGMPAEQRVLVNPTTFSEGWEPQYARRGALGSSQEVLQYIRTNTRTINIDLWVSWQIYIQSGWVVPEKGPLHFRDYFAALTVPKSTRGVPPVLEFHWPGARLAFNGVIDSIQFEYERFSLDGEPQEYTIRLRMVEHTTKLRVASQTFRNGLGFNAEP